jgi:hypothetical protein
VTTGEGWLNVRLFRFCKIYLYVVYFLQTNCN